MSSWKQLDQLLTCAICLDRYKNPKLLPCHHTYCMEPCLEGLVDYARRQIKCPECRAEHRIPYQGVQTFPTNVTLIRFLDLHRAVTGEEPEPPQSAMERCGVCSEKNYVERCSHCDKKICQECRDAHLDIMRREIGRITGQIRRGLNRLTDTLSATQRNNEKLERCREHVQDEIEEMVRRYIKDLQDAEERLKHELDLYVQGESTNLTKLHDDLEIEVNNITSNCDMLDKHIIDDNEEWTDSELMEYKDISLKTLDFLRNFDADVSDFARRVKFQANADPEVLHKTLIGFGEIKLPPAPSSVSAPAPIHSTPSLSNLAPPVSNTLMRSQSDHRLASQFQRKQERAFLDPLERSRTSYGGHASDSESRGDRDYFGRSKREDYRRHYDRSSYLDDSRDQPATSMTRGNRFLRPSDDYPMPTRWSRGSDHDEPHGFRSRFARELVSDDDPDSSHYHSHSRSVRFEEPSSGGSTTTSAPPAPVRVMDTEDATRGPLSGVIRLLDSPYVLGRLHQNEARQKQQENEKANEPPPPAPAPAPTPTPVPPTRRTTTRQLSEDMVEKEKKQAQATASSGTPPPPATPPPAAVAPTPTAVPATTERPVPKRIASLQKDTEERTPPASPRSDSRESSSSRGSPFEDAPSSPPPQTAEPRNRWRRTSADSTSVENTESAPRPRPESPRQSQTTPRQVPDEDEHVFDPSYYPSSYVPRPTSNPLYVSSGGGGGEPKEGRTLLPYNRQRHSSDIRFDRPAVGSRYAKSAEETLPVRRLTLQDIVGQERPNYSRFRSANTSRLSIVLPKPPEVGQPRSSRFPPPSPRSPEQHTGGHEPSLFCFVLLLTS